MELTLGTLIALMVVLLLAALGLVIFIIRALRKNPAARSRSESAGESESASAKLKEMISEAPPRPEEALSSDAASTVAPRAAVSASEPFPKELAFESAAIEYRVGPGLEPESVLLMKVWQDPEGYLVVEVGAQSYRRLIDVRDGAVGRQLLETIGRLVRFSKGQDSRADPRPAPTTVPTAEPTGPSVPNAAGDSPGHVFWDQSSSQNELSAKKTRISMDPVPFRRKDGARQRGITLNLATEIEELLQSRLKALPQFDQRYIHVASAPDGGLRFDVDGARYGSIDEIPDLQVQQMIRAAISDWESKR